MTLIKSISGIRGTLDGKPGESLTEEDVIKFTRAYGQWVLSNSQKQKVVIGRDARPSGVKFLKLIGETLTDLGISVVDIGLSTTPTVEMAVVAEEAGGGIVVSASHNPVEWNALKLLNGNGEFLSRTEGEEVLSNVDKPLPAIGESTAMVRTESKYIDKHIGQIIALPMVLLDEIRRKKFKVAVDPVNSSGAISVPPLLDALGVEDVVMINGEPSGAFAHNPEPLPENLTELSKVVVENECDLGISVDPDVDRLALIDEKGGPFGEEYTLVAVADYILQQHPGPTVSNLSSTQALRVITERKGQEYRPAAVGEVNVVNVMKEIGAVIGGEGNGGVIYPELHYGRDALVGIALFLSHLARTDKSVSELRASYPAFVISKNKMQFGDNVDVDQLLQQIHQEYSEYPTSTVDGVKIEFPKNGPGALVEWVHLRKSNTEPIVRIYSESDTLENANLLADRIMARMDQIVQSS